MNQTKEHSLRRFLAVAASLVAAAVLSVLVGVSTPAGAAPEPDGAFIVVLRDRVESARAVANEHRQSRGAVIGHVYESALKGYSARLRGSELGALRSDPRVAYVVEDGIATKSAVTSPQNGATWGLDRIDQRKGRDGAYRFNTTGLGVHAYVIDTGLETNHSEFEGRAIFGDDLADDGTPVGADCDGHGTHVAGTIGGKTWGVAKEVTLVGVRVLDCNGSGSWSDVIAGISWVNANAVRPAVANMSLGGGRNQAVDDAVAASINDGIAYAVSAGNNNADACRYSPARTPDALTVAASDLSDRKASFSNHGPCVDLFAPGVGVTSSVMGEKFESWNGTSMASPHVAGVAALYLQGKPQDTPASAVVTAVVSNATPNVMNKLPPKGTTPNRLLYSLIP